MYQQFKAVDTGLLLESHQLQPRQSGAQNPAPQNRPVGTPATGRPMFRDQMTGEQVMGYAHGQPIGQDNETPLGEIVRAAVLNDWSGIAPDVRASVTGGSDTGGGYLLEPTLSPRFVDLARAASVVSRAGAVTIPIGGETNIATLTSDPTTYWRGETVSVTASKPAFGRIVLRPKTVAALVPVSIEWLEDVANGAAVIETALQSAMGLAMNQAALIGTGAGAEPLGVVNHTGVNTIGSVGTPTTYTNISAAVGDILGANFDGDVSSLAWIHNPTQGETYDGLVTGISGDNTPLMPTQWAGSLRKFSTTSLAANIVGFGTITASAVTSIKVQQGAASDLSDAADLLGTGITVAADDDNQIVAVRWTRCGSVTVALWWTEAQPMPWWTSASRCNPKQVRNRSPTTAPPWWVASCTSHRLKARPSL